MIFYRLALQGGARVPCREFTVKVAALKDKKVTFVWAMGNDPNVTSFPIQSTDVQKIRVLNSLGDKLLAGNEDRFSRRFKSKHLHTTTLKTPNPRLDIFVSSVMSLIEFLLCISIPFALLERPCDIFLEKKMYTMYEIVTILEKYMPMIDRIIIALFIMLLTISVDTVVVAIKNTIIKIS